MPRSWETRGERATPEKGGSRAMFAVFDFGASSSSLGQSPQRTRDQKRLAPPLRVKVVRGRPSTFTRSHRRKRSGAFGPKSTKARWEERCASAAGEGFGAAPKGATPQPSPAAIGAKRSGALGRGKSAARWLSGNKPPIFEQNFNFLTF